METKEEVDILCVSDASVLQSPRRLEELAHALIHPNIIAEVQFRQMDAGETVGENQIDQ